jgi:hypothetical protein
LNEEETVDVLMNRIAGLKTACMHCEIDIERKKI